MKVGIQCTIALFLLIAASILPSPVLAQATRTWVSGVGDDANPCSRTAPCKTFAGAISKTAAGGEINCLDPGGYGVVTITKAMTISCEGVGGGILATGTNGVIVNAGPTDAVVLRGVDIQGGPGGMDGVRFIAGGSLLVQDSTIQRMLNSGGSAVAFIPSTNARLTLVRVTLVDNAGGLRVASSDGEAEVSVIDSHIIGNSGVAISAHGTGVVVRLGNVNITGNDVGLATENGAQILSYGDNLIHGNRVNGAASAKISKQ